MHLGANQNCSSTVVESGRDSRTAASVTEYPSSHANERASVGDLARDESHDQGRCPNGGSCENHVDVEPQSRCGPTARRRCSCHRRQTDLGTCWRPASQGRQVEKTCPEWGQLLGASPG